MGSRRCRAYDDRDRSAGDREGEADEESPVRENAEGTEDDLRDAPGKALRGPPEGHRGREDHEGAGRDAQEEPRCPAGSLRSPTSLGAPTAPQILLPCPDVRRRPTSRADEDLVPVRADRERLQAGRRVHEVLTRPDVVLPAVPGTDDRRPVEVGN